MDVLRRNKGEAIGILSLVFLLSLIDTIDAQVKSNLCSENCIDRTCADPYGSPKRLACSYGCVDGYWGNKCVNSCPATCTSCDRSFGASDVCYGCTDGYYLTDSSTQCILLTCPIGCNSCSSATSCTACKTGYYKVNTECRPCLANCAKCSSEIDCIECNTNYAGDTCGYCVYGKFGPSCAFICPEQCQKCTSYSVCQDCVAGRYNSDLVKDCSLTSPPCPDNCLSCNSASDCSTCKGGFYNTASVKDCSNACSGRCAVCDSATSCSACNGNYAGTVCQNCVDGKYGQYCNIDCPYGCQSCISDNECPVCKPNFTGDKCEKCIDGKYGAFCNDCRYQCQSCTEYDICQACKTGYYNSDTIKNCSLTSPPCPHNCESCISADDCQTCKAGFYNTASVKDCSNVCPDRCKVCDSPISCSVCKENYAGTVCQNCKDGRHGDSCGKTCPVECKSCSSASVCDQCTDGNFSPAAVTDCSSTCPIGCNACSSSTYCTSCKPNFKYENNVCENCVDGKYWTECGRSCPGSCLDSICDRDNGHCLNCPPGFAGNSCDHCEAGKRGNECSINCSSNCLNKTCDRYSRYCSNGCINDNFIDTYCAHCKNGYHGPACTQPCPHNCKDDTCDQENGKCTHGCKWDFTGEYCDQCADGKFGINCDILCSTLCHDNVCERNDGACTPCKTGYYGNKCDISCSQHCSGEACHQTVGSCSNGCIEGYSGDKCCLQSQNCAKCSTNDDCEECVVGWHGETCNKTCSGNCNKNACSKIGTACLQGCMPGYTGSFCSEAVDEGNKGGPPVAAIVGGVAGGVVALLIVAVIVIFLKRRKRHQGKDDFVNAQPDIHVPPEIVPASSATLQQKKTSKKKAAAPVETEENEVEGDEDPKVYENDNKEYINVGDIRKRVAVADLDKVVAKKSTQDFLDEYKLFPKGLVKPYNDSRLPQNLPMNRYASIYPYDENRVRIRGRHTDYVNASYIDGYKRNNAYIASLGPTKAAMDEFQLFWDMLWQEKVEKIVMLTNLVENTNMKCEQYWPDANLTMSYGHVTVKNVHEEVNAEYTVRNFSVERDSETRVVSQVHFTAWPDKGVPDHVTSIVEFHGKVKSLKHELGGTILVHCSAGIGRTGTYIALDILTAEGEDKGYVDVFNCVMTLRYQRINMVQTSDQYIYLHKAVAHNLTFDSKPITAAKFHEATSNTSVEEFEHKFKRLNETMEKMTPEEEEAQRQSKTFSELNRKGTDIPGNRHRPRLFRFQTMGDHDYINAVYINSFKFKNHFIAAQTPLPATVEDFIKLILQENCTVVVNLEPETLRIKSIGDYLPPDNQTVTHGQFKVTSIRLISPDAYSLRQLVIQQEGNETETTVHCFQVNEWPAKDHVPKDHVTFLRFMKDVKEKARELDTDDDGAAPILLHCLSGAQKCGLFCALHNCVEKMESEQEVSVGNIVRQIRFRRRTAFPNKDQLIFCYKAVSAYLESCNTYSNFDLRL